MLLKFYFTHKYNFISVYANMDGHNAREAEEINRLGLGFDY
jgi:hypothetical protein